MSAIRSDRTIPLMLLALLAGGFGCSGERSRVGAAAPAPLAAGVGEQITEGTGSSPCSTDDETARQRAVRDALANAVQRAAALYGDAGAVPVDEVVRAHRVERYWQGEGQCFAAVQAVVETARLQELSRTRTRGDLRALGRPQLTFVIASYRILPNTAYTTRRAAAEVIDSLQQELIVRGFDVHRSLSARRKALAGGGTPVLDVSSAERDEIAATALKDGVAFLVQGEIKVTDEGKQADGDYLAVVDGSLEAVDLRTERVVGAFRDVATAKHAAASAAYTTAISGFARSAAAELAPQMLDSWKQADAAGASERSVR